MKKFIALFLVLALSLFVAVGCAGENNNGENGIYRDINGNEIDISLNIYRDPASPYPNYAEVAVIDPVKHPEAQDMGLFWLGIDEDGEVIERRASTAEGASLVNPDLPTVITVHGLQFNGGHRSPERFKVSSSIVCDYASFGVEEGNLDMSVLVLNHGHNVANFYWHRFAADEPNATEKKIWSKDGAGGVSYKLPNEKFNKGEDFDFSVAEFFVGEYLRAIKLIEGFGANEIRIAGHSMGTPLVTATAFILTELVRTKALHKSLIPNRIALLDGFLGIVMLNVSLPAQRTTLSWTGKPHVKRSSSETLLACLNALNNSGVAVEFYYLYNGITAKWAGNTIDRIHEVSAFVTLYPDLKTENNNYKFADDGHGAVRLWYYSSIVFPPVGQSVPSGGASSEAIRGFLGKKFIQTGGTTTLFTGDDIFESDD
ncbi:MAG: hypothetical protein FWD49_03625 [Firmicutes bacterium]|nr:hypothetical protein [Bacillota bacterium]